MTSLQLLLDVILSVALLALAWRALVSPELFRSIVFFMAFSLIMAMTWARLAAPDIALAEAAIGAGVTSALLLSTLKAVTSSDPPEASGDPEEDS